jgi:hypothetical protein
MSSSIIYQSEEFLSMFERFKHENPDELSLKLSSQKINFKKELIQQIQGWQKSKDKLPLWHTTNGIIFPPKINLEQCSSEKTAKYKSEFYKGEIGIDLTGGFGIDTYFFSQNFDTFYYIEPNKELLDIVTHNFNLLGVSNVSIIHSTAENFIQNFNKKVDFIFIDPSRRDENNRKLSAFKDTQPDIFNLIPQLQNISNILLIKASPMLDIKQAIHELEFVNHVKIIAVENECKELLFELNFQQKENDPTIIAVDINNDSIKEFTFKYSEERAISANISNIETYLYEPSAAIIKAGAFKNVCKNYSLKKLHPNTHLYTSNELIENFQGRIFKINHICSYKKDEVLSLLENKKANVSIRNFKDSPELVKKKLSLKDGGDKYLFACTNNDNKPEIIICDRIL